MRIRLPNLQGNIEDFAIPDLTPIQSYHGTFNRVVFAATHVVGDPDDPGKIDWDATISYRRYLWDCNLGVAEAMDTAQRGVGLHWNLAKQLIKHSLEAADEHKRSLIACGCGTDHLDQDKVKSLDDVIAAYEEQLAYIESLNGRVVLLASRALTTIAKSPDDYMKVYNTILSQCSQPVIIHWLGEMFDPALKGYWGYEDHRKAMEVVIQIIRENQTGVDGIKISLLDKEIEIEMRRKLPPGVRMYTGDDFNFAELIAGDEHGHSDALLGIFDAIAPAASAALGELSEGNTDRYYDILQPCIPLSRLIFSEPTYHYKTGIVFLAWINGHQQHFRMLGGQEDKRTIQHLSQIFRLAAKAGLLPDPEVSVSRMRSLLKSQRIDA